MKKEDHCFHSGKLRNMASVYLKKNGKFLLLYRQGSSIVSNLWIGSAGGHFESEEFCDAKACVLRELKEELNLSPDNLQDLNLRYITIRYTEGEVRQNYYFFAHLKDHIDTHLSSNEGETHWFYPDELSKLSMPITAKFVMEHYQSTGQFNNNLYGGLSSVRGMHFEEL